MRIIAFGDIHDRPEGVARIKGFSEIETID